MSEQEKLHKLITKAVEHLNQSIDLLEEAAELDFETMDDLSQAADDIAEIIQFLRELEWNDSWIWMIKQMRFI